MQGPEPYPSENYNAFFANFARNGAGIVDACRWDEYPNQRNGDLKSSHTHMPAFDLTNPATLNYVSELAEEVHLYGSKILINLGPSTVLMKGRMQSVEDLRALGKDGLWLPEDATEAEIEALLDKYVEQVQLYVDCGFDGVSDRIDACLCPFRQ
jgi:2,4-dienoyl-CoA reductase-like NADH-dependent reductase (Old Yellow Enzyme family)